MDSIVFEKFNEDVIRKNEIDNLNNDAKKLLEIQNEFNLLVDKQNEQLNIIEEFVEKAKDKTEETNNILIETEEIKKTIDKRYMWGSVLLVPLIYLILL